MAEAGKKSDYQGKNIKVLEGLEGVRRKFDVVELSKKVKKHGDILVLSQELKIRPRILKSAIHEGRVRGLILSVQKSKAGILSGLRTDREIEIFSSKFDIKDTSPKKLLNLVRSWKLDLEKNPKLLLSDLEHDLVIGSLLGDASIRKRDRNSCFRVSHSVKQRDYLKWKKDILENFDFSEFSQKKRVINGRDVEMISLATKTHSVFNYYRNLFYGSGKKKVSREILNELNPRSLAVWICDDGSFSQTQGYIILCTYSFSLEEHELMKKFFEEKFGLSPTIGFRDGKYYYLRFKKEDSRKLVGIIRPYVPSCMLYKIGGKNE